MTYLIIDHCSNKILLSAYLNPNDTYYIHLTQDTTDNVKGKNYILSNIIFGEPNRQPDRVLWDDQALSVDSIVKLNEFLEIDKPAYVGSLYCEELEQLLEYEPFLGNSSCKVPDKINDTKNKKTFIVRHDLEKSIDYLKTIFDMNYTIVTLGDYQKIVPEDKIMVYKPCMDMDTDINNLIKILSYDNKAFLPSISMNALNDYETKLVEKLLENIQFDEKWLLLTYFDVVCKNFKYNFKDYDKVLFSDRLIKDTKYCGQYQQIFYGIKNEFYRDCKDILNDNEYTDLLNKVIDIIPIGDEWISEHDMDILFSKTFRERHPDVWSDPMDRINRPFDIDESELLYQDYGLITELYQEKLDKKSIQTVKIG